MFQKGESIITIVLFSLLLLLISPLDLLMPTNAGMMVIVALVLVFSAYAAFIWKEKSRDEREDFHKLLAGRIAFLAGAGVLVAGIVTQSLNHNIDPWLVFTLAVMILSKLLVHLVSRLKH